jgi:hypothetical protein
LERLLEIDDVELAVARLPGHGQARPPILSIIPQKALLGKHVLPDV